MKNKIKNIGDPEKWLTDKQIEKIQDKFVHNSQDNYSVCDEYHAHSFECINWYNEHAMIIQRLCLELNKYHYLVKWFTEKLIKEKLIFQEGGT